MVYKIINSHYIAGQKELLNLDKLDYVVNKEPLKRESLTEHTKGTALATPTTQNKRSRKYFMTCKDITSRKDPAKASVTGRKFWNNTRIFAHSNTALATPTTQIKRSRK
ncbi:MAG: hypothetical protein JXB88_25480 [Spirochaetales bacterium]|nr:hypothetical protein [Spirochaetales bacterium]